MKPLYLLLTLFSVFSVGFPGGSFAQRVIYVDRAALGADNGTSITNAFVSLQDALEEAQAGDEIRVVAGVYTPDQGRDVTAGDRTATFVIKNGVRLIGGFNREDLSPDNPTPATWDWRANPTILSGDLLGNDNTLMNELEPSRLDNSISVVVALRGTDTTTVIEGFFIESGHREVHTVAKSAGFSINNGQLRLRHLEFRNNFSVREGAAILSGNSSLWLSDVTFLDNVSEGIGGGALYSFSENGLIDIHDSYFARNKGRFGGAMYIIGGGLFVTETTFLQNEGSAGGAVMHKHLNPQFGGSEAVYTNVAFLGNEVLGVGGAMCNEDESIVTIYNGLFSGNKAISEWQGNQLRALGGAIVNFEGSRMTLIQSTMVNNTARNGGFIHNSSGDVFIYNSILQGNQSDSLATTDISFNPEFGALTLNHTLLQLMPDGAIDQGGNQLGFALFMDPVGPDGIAGTIDDDLRQAPGSPTIDTGNNDVLPLDLLDIDQDGDLTEVLPLDMDRHERIASGEVHGLRVDLGAYEFNATTPISTNNEGPEYQDICSAGLLAAAYPNPFSYRTHLAVCVPVTGPALVTLYDILGRRQALLFDGVIQANQPIPLTIDRNSLASGVYFVQLEHPTARMTQSVVIR